jgi:SCY1-like protein 2
MVPRPSGNFHLVTIGCRPSLNGLLITSVCNDTGGTRGHRTHVAAKAPEYVLDEVLNTASDMYSLGCLICAVHLKGNPPFKNFGNLASVREHAGRPLSGIAQLDRDLQGIFLWPLVCFAQRAVAAMLVSLVTRHPQNRPTPASLPSLPFFSSLPISTLNFLDRSNFAAKSREEKISFMKGLTSVLDRFSEGLRVRKILPSLLEEVRVTTTDRN